MGICYRRFHHPEKAATPQKTASVTSVTTYIY